MTSEPLLDALDALVEAQADRVEVETATLDALRNVRDAAAGGNGDDPPSTDLAAPAGFTATYDEPTRKVQCRWTPQADDVERHERWKDPANTLKAIISGDQGKSTSSELAGGPYEWALRTRRGDAVSDFTQWIRTDVPTDDEQPDEDDDQGGDDETPPGQNGPTPLDLIPELRTWTVMLPRGSEGDPDNDYAGDWGNIPDLFFARDNAVVLRCPADGVTSGGSDYPRTELRQMVDTEWTKAAWPSSGAHTLTCDLAIDTRGLTTRPRISAMQIHDGGDDVMQLIYERGVGLGVSHKDGNAWELLWRDYRDAQAFRCAIGAVDDHITVNINGLRLLDIPKSGSGWYWKVGTYIQSGGQSKHHEPEGAYGEVVLYSLTTTGGGQ